MRAGEIYFVNGSPNIVMWGRKAPDVVLFPAEVAESPAVFSAYKMLLRTLIARRIGEAA